MQHHLLPAARDVAWDLIGLNSKDSVVAVGVVIVVVGVAVAAEAEAEADQFVVVSCVGRVAWLLPDSRLLIYHCDLRLSGKIALEPEMASHIVSVSWLPCQLFWSFLELSCERWSL